MCGPSSRMMLESNRDVYGGRGTVGVGYLEGDFLTGFVG